jgi:dTDP-glucose 4,6-dehydratase
VEDHCAAIDLILQKGKNGEIYNIGSTSEKSNLEVVRLILSILNKPEELITFVADRPGHDLRYCVDARKIQSELGWIPKTDFGDGLERTVDWYVKNKSWWQNIISGSYRNSVILLTADEMQLKLF